MRLTYSQDRKRYEVSTSYSEYQAGLVEHVKRAGFRFQKEPIPVWHSSSIEAASLLIEYADESCKTELFARASERNQALTESRAHDADISSEGLGITPYPFQKAGIKYAMSRNRVLFGSEMGLGKSGQVLATIHLKWAYPCIAVVPASLKINFKKEAIMWNPELREGPAVRIISGRWKTGIKLIEGRLDPGAMLWILNYELVDSWLPELKSIGAKALILDESHFCKTSASLRTKACLELAHGIEQRYLLTGTPLVNRPDELWPQLEILGVADQFGKEWDYYKRYCDLKSEKVWMKDPVTHKAKQKLVWHHDGATNLGELNKRLRETCMVRHLKSEVMPELPPIQHQVIEIACNGLKSLVDQELKTDQDYQAAKAHLETIKETASVSGQHETFEKACSLLQKAYNAWLGTMAKLAHDIAMAKLPKVIEYCLETLNENEKACLFLHHHDAVFAAEKAFMDKGIETVRLTGMENKEEKDAAIIAFQEGSARMFIGSLRAAGLGITLTKASRAIMGELDWTPGTMDQAAARLHRIGQKDSVLIQYIVLENSLDSHKIQKLLVKGQVIRDTIN